MKTMKLTSKRLLLGIILWALPIAIYSKTIQIDIDVTDFNFLEVGDQELITSEKYLLQYNTDTLSTPLPYYTINIYLNSEIDRYSITVLDSLVRNNINIIKPQTEEPTNATKVTNSNMNQSDISTEQCQIVELNGVSKFRDNLIANFKIYPFSIKSSDKSLYINKKINIEIEEKTKEDLDIISIFEKKTLTDLTLNYVDTANVGTCTPLALGSKCLIITNNTLKSAFESLAKWKTQKGVKTRILTVEDIDAMYSDSSLPVKIKRAIRDIYNGEERILEYVLLGGDVSVVPSKLCFIKYFNETDSTPTDLFYSCMDDLDWDSNGNNVYGEVSDNIDIMPELIVSRISVNTPEEANNIVSRLLNYERSPIANSWKNDILMCGAIISKYITDNNTGKTISDAQYNGEALYNDIISKYWICDRTRLYDTGTDFIGDENYDFSETSLQLELSKGYTIAHIDTHGSYSSLKTEGVGSYMSNSANSLNNSGSTTIITSACNTNMFDTQTCLSELFMRNPNGGILSYLGSSRYGWSVSSNEFNRVIYDYLLKRDNKKIGEALFYAKLYYAGNSLSYNTPKRWLMFSLNLLGDPEMPLYTTTPQRFENIHFIKEGHNLVLNTGGVNCNVCLMSLDDFGETCYSCYEGVTDITMENVLDNISICFTKPNYIPSTYILSQNKYIQNEQFSQDINIYSENIYIGNNVSSNIENGPVNINAGNFKVYYTRELLIDSEVEIKKGASFEAKVFK